MFKNGEQAPRSEYTSDIARQSQTLCNRYVVKYTNSRRCVKGRVRIRQIVPVVKLVFILRIISRCLRNTGFGDVDSNQPTNTVGKERMGVRNSTANIDHLSACH